MNQKNDDIMKKVLEAVQEGINKYMWDCLDDKTLKSMQKEVIRILKPFGEGILKRFDYELSGYDPVTKSMTIIPHNLYTALIMRGFHVTWQELEGKDTFEDPDGGIWHLSKENKLTHRPRRPSEYITLDFIIDKDGNLLDGED